MKPNSFSEAEHFSLLFIAIKVLETEKTNSHRSNITYCPEKLNDKESTKTNKLK